jgi:hypothetical protein
MFAALIVAVLLLQLSLVWGTYRCSMHCTALINNSNPVYNTCIGTSYGYYYSDCKTVLRQFSAQSCNVHIYGFTVKVGNVADCEAMFPYGYAVQYSNEVSTCTSGSNECDFTYAYREAYPDVEYDGSVAGYLAARFFIIAAIVLASVGFVYLAGRLLLHCLSEDQKGAVADYAVACYRFVKRNIAAASCSCVGCGCRLSFKGNEIVSVDKNDNDHQPLMEMVPNSA